MSNMFSWAFFPRRSRNPVHSWVLQGLTSAAFPSYQQECLRNIPSKVLDCGQLLDLSWNPPPHVLVQSDHGLQPAGGARESDTEQHLFWKLMIMDHCYVHSYLYLQQIKEGTILPLPVWQELSKSLASSTVSSNCESISVCPSLHIHEVFEWFGGVHNPNGLILISATFNKTQLVRVVIIRPNWNYQFNIITLPYLLIVTLPGP